MREVSRRDLIALSGLAGLGVAAGCGVSDDPTRRTAAGVPASKSSATPSAEDMSVAGPKDLSAPLLSSDMLLYSKDSLSADMIKAVEAIRSKDGKPAFVAVEQMAMGEFYVNEQPVTYAAVDPRTFWRFTVPGTAQTPGVWQRVAGGEIAVQPKIGKELQTKDGYLALGNDADALKAHIGAYAQLLDPGYARQIDAVVNQKWVKPLAKPPGNAAILSMGEASPKSVFKQLQAATGTSTSIQILGPNLDLSVAQTAVLSGGAVANKIRPFNYTANSNGSVNPDPAWVAEYIRTEQMPIIGSVRGNKIMLPQLRGALEQVVREGRSKSIYQYGGCYVPRFIAGTHTLSFHSFGTAIDLNVADNQRGTVGKMDRHVVDIFRAWGFAWGGTWKYTDPMHFELETLARKT